MFSTSTSQMISSSPFHVGFTGASTVSSTPNSVEPEPSPDVVSTSADFCAGAPGWSGGVGCSLAFAFTVVIHEPSAFCASVTLRNVSALSPDSIGCPI